MNFSSNFYIMLLYLIIQIVHIPVILVTCITILRHNLER